MNDDRWVYKDHQCQIEIEHEEDNQKAWYSVTTPTGKVLIAHLSPYRPSREFLEHWIDLGYPVRESGCFLDLKHLMTGELV